MKKVVVGGWGGGGNFFLNLGGDNRASPPPEFSIFSSTRGWGGHIGAFLEIRATLRPEKVGISIVDFSSRNC